jgi:hypothetical protein
LPIESTILKSSDDKDDDDDDNGRNKHRYLLSKSICGWMKLASSHPEL